MDINYKNLWKIKKIKTLIYIFFFLSIIKFKKKIFFNEIYNKINIYINKKFFKILLIINNEFNNGKD